MIFYSINNFNTTKECTDEEGVQVPKTFAKKIPKTSRYNTKKGKEDLTEKPDQMDPENQFFMKKIPELNDYKFKQYSTPRSKQNKLQFLKKPNQSTE